MDSPGGWGPRPNVEDSHASGALMTRLAARRFGYVSDEAASLVVDLANRSKADPADVDARAQDGLDDVILFGGRNVRPDLSGANGETQ